MDGQRSERAHLGAQRAWARWRVALVAVSVVLASSACASSAAPAGPSASASSAAPAAPSPSAATTIAAAPSATTGQAAPTGAPGGTAAVPTTAAAAAAATVPPAATDIWTRLASESGLVVLMRHATAPGSGDPSGFRLGDCSTQRNLSDEGRREAAAIGASLREHRVPVTQILASQWCRATETATLLDVGAVEGAPALNYLAADATTAASQTEATLALIAAAGERTGVTVMVTHSQNIAALAERSPSMGAALVIAPSSGAELNVVATIDDW